MRLVAALVVLAVAIGLAACGDDADSGQPPTTTSGASAPATLDGRDFIVTGTEGRELVAGTTVRFSFDDGRVGVNAGCNSMSGSYQLDGDELVVGAMASTEMACEPALMDQDQWLAELLQARPRVAVDGDRMTVTGQAAALTLTDRAVVEPDLPLEGTTWTLDGIIARDAVSSVPGGVTATMELANGMALVDTSCNTGSADAEVRADSIVFGPLALTKMACPSEQTEVERAFVAVLMGEVAYEIEASSLTLRNGPNGLVFTGAAG
jgi:heat shock protein HslJ